MLLTVEIGRDLGNFKVQNIYATFKASNLVK